MSKPVKSEPVEKKTPPKKKNGKTTKQLMDMHMHDKNHTISAEDIENLDLNLGHPETVPPPPETILPSEDDRPEEEKKSTNKDAENKKITPWDLLGT